MIIYLNLKNGNSVETIDQINRKDFKTFSEFSKEKKRLLKEYRLASNYYAGIYTSQRCTNDWRQ